MRYGRTPLYSASWKGHDAVVAKLVSDSNSNSNSNSNNRNRNRNRNRNSNSNSNSVLLACTMGRYPDGVVSTGRPS